MSDNWRLTEQEIEYELKPRRKRLYFAYGSNLNIEQMSHRCPDAEPVCELRLKNWKLIFRGVADVVEQRDAICDGGVWVISATDEEALDLYEGIRSGLYRKVYLPIADFKYKGHVYRDMLMYVMNSDGVYPPSKEYLAGIEEGYRDFRMADKAAARLDAAVQHSWRHKRPSRHERERCIRKGWPKLAKPKDGNCRNCGFCPRPRKPEQLHLTTP